MLASNYRESAGAPLKVALYAPDGGKPSKILEIPNGSELHWLPDGRALADINTQKGIANIWALPIAVERKVEAENLPRS